MLAAEVPLKRFLTVMLALLFVALAAEHVWFYRMFTRYTDLQTELALQVRAAAADRSDCSMSLALWDMRNAFLVQDLDSCLEEIRAIDRGICVPPSVFESLEQELKEWKREFEQASLERDRCLREPPHP
jgi:hypothetical protein